MTRPTQTCRAKLPPVAEWGSGETGFVVTFPDWGWGATQRETEAEALRASGLSRAELARRLVVQVRDAA